MEPIVRLFDQQYLAQTAADLRNRRAEFEKLRDLIRAAEASNVRGTSTALSGGYRAGLEIAIARGWLVLHEGGTHVKFTVRRR